jgi:D-arginine dehydrogenase
VAIDESWYFKPDAGLLLGSPANADPDRPHDVVAEELDVALGIHHIEQATTLTIRRPQRTWAGLRCFVADGEPVLGFEPGVSGFFWAAALGGYGIQSSPAVGRLCAALLRGEAVPQDLVEQGLQLSTVSAKRS